MRLPVGADAMLANDSLARQRSYTILDIEVDKQCGAGTLLSPVGCSHTRPSPAITLYKYKDIPRFLQGNPYIKRGYRAFLPASHCFYSLFLWNNETVNIWSHLIGFLIFFIAMFTDSAAAAWGSRVVHFTDHLYLIIGLLCYQACMILSAGYHMFYCHSEKACRRWLAMDLAGISIGILGCYMPGVHLAFYCHQVWRDMYMLIVSCLAAVTLGLQFHPRYLSRSWDNTRILLYSAVAGYGVVPSLHWIYLSGGFQTEIVQLFYGKIIGIYLLIALALVFYITKFPESLFPGRVDYIGSSHQWWHVIVVLAFLHWHRAGLTILQYRIDVPCKY